MASKADLHCHPTFSDGSLTPTQLVARAVQRGLEGMALTDHDCTDGVPEALEAAARYPGFLLIPGIELSTDAGAVGRPHIALAMLESGHIKTLDEAFEKYLGRNGPAYVEREKMTPAEAVELITGVGGLPVLAHPGQLSDLDRFLEELKGAGLLGMEVYYQDYGPGDVERLLAAARRHDLLPLGGSDYHGLGTARESELGDIAIAFE